MCKEILKTTALFQGVAPEHMDAVLKCLGARRKQFEKGQSIYRAGEVVRSLGIVLSGSVLVENQDFWGNETVLDRLGPGGIFAEAYACVAGEPLMVDVVARELAQVLFLDVERILQQCPQNCDDHGQLIRNLVTLCAQKNLSLSRKIFHTCAKTIRGRILSYLSYQAMRNGSNTFSIPFDRQQLAAYLGVDRSALSHELAKMQRDGLLKTSRNQFCLLDESDFSHEKI
ncbi:Crp/Fnr family transcriptional regulator [uncultured Ruthenibacterium sp.]|uniref:Crp/Fnr family transcriptional regulator n=1 Tax=uncultured Ruthenibacterium sp. TaxID=1905347 RepID=UPI00349EAE67